LKPQMTQISQMKHHDDIPLVYLRPSATSVDQ